MICSSVGITRFRLKPQVVSVQEGYVIFRFARVISFDQRPARLSENEVKMKIKMPSLIPLSMKRLMS